MTVYLIWEGNGLLIAASLLFLLIVIERSIHTEYKLSQDELTISNGKLSRTVVIPVSDIKRIERIRRVRIGHKALITYLVIVYGDEKTVSVIPQHEEDFINQLMKIKQS
ncbi:MAG: PH domain-containing protein [Bacteroidaceae bacterium]|nr:PH domain-containing protein [Bacteroidaceae bacterium]